MLGFPAEQRRQVYDAVSEALPAGADNKDALTWNTTHEELTLSTLQVLDADYLSPIDYWFRSLTRLQVQRILAPRAQTFGYTVGNDNYHWRMDLQKVAWIRWMEHVDPNSDPERALQHVADSLTPSDVERQHQASALYEPVDRSNGRIPMNGTDLAVLRALLRHKLWEYALRLLVPQYHSRDIRLGRVNVHAIAAPT